MAVEGLRDFRFWTYWCLEGGDGTLALKVYQKPTHTDLYLNGESFHHPSPKRSTFIQSTDGIG